MNFYLKINIIEIQLQTSFSFHPKAEKKSEDFIVVSQLLCGNKRLGTGQEQKAYKLSKINTEE